MSPRVGVTVVVPLARIAVDALAVPRMLDRPPGPLRSWRSPADQRAPAPHTHVRHRLQGAHRSRVPPLPDRLVTGGAQPTRLMNHSPCGTLPSRQRPGHQHPPTPQAPCEATRPGQAARPGDAVAPVAQAIRRQDHCPRRRLRPLITATHRPPALPARRARPLPPTTHPLRRTLTRPHPLHGRGRLTPLHHIHRRPTLRHHRTRSAHEPRPPVVRTQPLARVPPPRIQPHTRRPLPPRHRAHHCDAHRKPPCSTRSTRTIHPPCTAKTTATNSSHPGPAAHAATHAARSNSIATRTRALTARPPASRPRSPARSPRPNRGTPPDSAGRPAPMR